MKLVYTHPDSIILAQVRNALEVAGIDCTIRNEFASGASGELAPLDTWQEIWILQDIDYDRAKRIAAQFSVELDEQDWTCSLCGQASPATFETCWHCGSDRHAPA